MNHKKILLSLCCCFASLYLFGQLNIGGEPHSFSRQMSQVDLKPVILPDLNMTEIEREDQEAELEGRPPRFGYKHAVDFNLQNSGTWQNLQNGDRIWRLKLQCPKAKSINLLFDHFWLPAQSNLYVYTEDRRQLIGGFTELNNKGDSRADQRGFGTTLIYSNEVILEFYEPKVMKGQAIISLSSVVQGYQYIPNVFDGDGSFGLSGDCQVNVNCSPEGDNWQDEKRGVAAILVDGNRWCSGSLINNTGDDCTPYFLTAFHCGNNAGAAVGDNLDNWSFLWDYESNNCNNGTDFTPPCTNGAFWRAGENDTDFALLELDENPVDAGINVFFNGWSRTNNPTAGGVGIHHPRGDIKKISTHNMTPDGNSPCPDDANNYWEVNWIATANGHSVQQPASSGSPLFMNDGLIIGQLFGPFFCAVIQCEDPANQRVVYGRISASWNIGNNAQSRLRDWLDPAGNNPNQLAGVYPNCNNCPVDAAINNNPIPNGTYQVSNNITSTGTVPAGGNVVFDAGNSIRLLPNFTATNGCDFHAFINGCTNFAPGGGGGGILQRELSEATPAEDQFTEEGAIAITAFPNPFSDVTRISYTVNKEMNVQLEIRDFTGKLVRQIENVRRSEGTYQALFDGSNLPNGTYFCIIKGETTVKSHKIVLLRQP